MSARRQTDCRNELQRDNPPESPLASSDTTPGSDGLSWFGRYIVSFRLLSKNAKRYLLGAFLLGITQANIQLLFNLYLREREVTESVIGNIISSRATGAALMALPAGFLLLRTKLKSVLIASALVFSFFRPACDHRTDIACISSIAQQVIGAIK